MEKTFSSKRKEVAYYVRNDFKHHFYTLLKAIESVDYVKYVSNAENHDISDVPDVEIKIGEVLERTFAYELYRQWLNILEREKSDLTINAEVAKEISLMSKKEAFSQIMDGTTKYPDLILHKTNKIKGNVFVCEIKRHEGMNPTSIIYDISKLCTFLSLDIWKGNPYKYGIFIIIRESLSIINEILNNGNQSNEQFLLNHLKSEKTSLLKKIICISYNENLIKYDSLHNIIC